MISGMGITLGVTLAPVLMRDGVLLFISSADPRAQNKYGSPRQEWMIQEGDRLVIGSQTTSSTMTMYAQDVQVYIPDAMVSPRHALLFAKNKRFFVQLHPENVGPHGQPLEPLQIGDMNVVGTRELHNGDELVVGQTLLRFSTKRKQASYEGYPERRP
jgi:pSer/pThr/pTyr-binding forkhead associated (FHA) protein